MKGRLALYDVSSYIHTGMTREEYSGFQVQGFPMGGVKYFLRYLVYNLVNNADVAVMFDSWSDRREIMGSYKGGRSSVMGAMAHAQLDFLYDKLLQAGVPSYKERGFEADDLIFSAAEDLRSDYVKLEIYTADYDLAHNVDVKTTLQPANSNINVVTFNNFQHSVKRGKKIMLNTITAYKVFTGDSSDGIPTFIGEKVQSGETLYTAFCNFLSKGMREYQLDLTRNPQALLKFIEWGAGRDVFSPKDVAELKKRISIFYPRKAEGMAFEPRSLKGINIEGLVKLLSYCNDYESLKSLKRAKYSLLDEEIEDFRSRARRLKTGEFAVDHNIPVNEKDNSVVRSELLMMREF